VNNGQDSKYFDLLNKALKVNPDPVLIMTCDGNVLYFNPATKKFLEFIFPQKNQLPISAILPDNIENILLDMKNNSVTNKSVDYELVSIFLNCTIIKPYKDDVYNCSSFRNLIKNCKGPQAFHENRQQDSGEFLAYIFSLFQVNIAVKSETTYVTNNLDYNPDWIMVNERTDNRATPIVTVLPFNILEQKEYLINDFLVEIEDSTFTDENLYSYNGDKYRRRRGINKFVHSDYLIFNIFRNNYDPFLGAVKLRTPIIPVERIKDLNLNGIVVHEGTDGAGHYTAYIKNNNEWFFYNDIPNTVRKIGTYDDLLKSRPNVKTNGVQYFYV